MKRYAKSIGIAALALLPALANAQSSGNARPFSVGVSGGASFPVGDFGKGTSTGYSIAGHVFLLPPKLPNVGFRGDVAYDRWSFKGDALGNPVDGNVRSLAVTGNILLKMASSTSVLHPYIIAGAGGYNTKASSAGFTSDGQTNFGIQAGGGLEFGLSGFSSFIEAKYVTVFGNNSSDSKLHYVPLTFGIRF